MQTIVYGAKTFILENPAAARLMLDAKQLRANGLMDASMELVRIAVKVETGTLSANEALLIAHPQRAAA